MKNGWAARAVFLDYAALGASVALGLLVTPFLLRMLGREQYGLWAVLGSVVAYLAYADIGLSGGLLRTLARSDLDSPGAETQDLVSGSLTVYAVIAAFAVVAAAIVAPFIPSLLRVEEALSDQARTATIILGVSAAGSFVMAVPVAALSGAQRLDVVNALNLFTLLGRSIVSVVAVALGTGLIGMSLAQAATSAAGAVFALVAAKRVAPALLLRPRLVGFREVVRLLPLSARLTVMAISVQVIFYTDNVIIGVVLGVAAVAPYAVGFQVFDLAMKLTWRPVDVLLPFYAKAHASGSRAAVAAALLASTRVSLCLALAVTLPLVVFAEDLLALWIGGDNVAPWPVLMGFAALVILHAPVHSAAILVSAVTNARWMFWCSIAESVLNVALSLALAHAIGLVG
ncbi:MAG: lipopolysaccharide biosynthesis protein, partial [Chloroflexota bacterium]